MNNFLIFCQKSRYLLALSLPMSLALSACDTPQVSVKKEWETTINSYGLRPVYPMRENVYVGDLRVTGHKKDDFSLNYRYFGQLDIAGVFKKEIKGRPELAETPNKTNYTITLADGTEKTLQRFEQPSASDVTAPRGHSNRMFLAALPSLKIASVKAADIGIQAPAGTTKALSEAGFRLSDTVAIRLEGIESLEISDSAVWDALKKQCGESGEIKNSTALTAALGMVTPADFAGTKIKPDGWLHVITRVFYARSIHYNRTISKSFATVAQASKGDLSENKINAQPLSNGNEETPAAVTDKNMLTGLPVSVPGVAASFVSKSDTGIEMIQIFERPMAFGVDVLSVRLIRGKDDLVKCGGPVTHAPRNTQQSLTGGVVGVDLDGASK